MMHRFARGTFVLTAIVLATILIFVEASDSEDSLEGETSGVFRECADFPFKEMIMDGFATVMQPIACNEPVVVHVEGELVIHAVILNLTNVHFDVRSGGSLTLKAEKAIKIQRDESSTKPLVNIDDGEVKVEARGWIPYDAKGTVEDDGGVVSMKEGGSLYVSTKSTVGFTANSMMVLDVSRKDDEIVSLDGNCVMRRFRPSTREWMNRFPWRKNKSDTYALRATKDGPEVVDGEGRVRGICDGNLA